MTNYNFCLEMEYLCQRAEAALRKLKNHSLANIYYHAARGYHQRSEELSAAKAEEKTSSRDYGNLKILRSFVENKELEATKERLG